MPDRNVNEAVLRTQGNVPDDHVILRDHNDPNDPIVPRGSAVDLADGTEFYSVPECDINGDRPHCSAPAKHVVTDDDQPETLIKTDQTGRSVRDFFGLSDSANLFWDVESPEDIKIEDGDPVDVSRGNVFLTRADCCSELVEIKINGDSYEISPGTYSVPQIKALPDPDIPSADELSMLVDGRLKALAADETVKICEGRGLREQHAQRRSSVEQ